MDIFFCDLCGVRVTDADLRTGHGMRDAHDVICSACLELGHHKEWLSRRAKPARPAAISQSAGTPPVEASDRVATLDEREPEPALKMVDMTPSGPMQVLPEDHTSTAKVPTPGSPMEMPLAGAASLFSALGEQVRSRPGPSGKTDSRPEGDSEDDLLDQAEHLGSGTPEPAASPFADDVTSNSEKAETAMVPAMKKSGKSVTEEAPPVEEEPTTKPSTSSRRKAEGGRKSSSARHAKPASGKGKSARSARGRSSGGDSSRMILFGSLISLLLIFVVFGAVMASKGKKTTTQTSSGLYDSELKSRVQSTMTQVVSAIRSEDVGQLRAAKAAIESTADLVDSFEIKAKRDGNSQEQIDSFLERVAKWPECYAMKRTVNDLLVKLSH